jgi:hypothetical protein
MKIFSMSAKRCSAAAASRIRDILAVGRGREKGTNLRDEGTCDWRRVRHADFLPYDPNLHGRGGSILK